jgi:hypothetical protein
MDKDVLKKILGEHMKWLCGEGGARANLSGANLSGGRPFEGKPFEGRPFGRYRFTAYHGGITRQPLL